MISAESVNKNEFVFKVDTLMFPEKVLAKVMYWYAGMFNIFSHVEDGICTVKLIYKDTEKHPYTFEKIRDKFNQDLIDYKARILIEEETKSIRDILYIKAFSNDDTFEDTIL